MKVLFMTNVPSPYRVDFFNELGKHCNLTVLFETNTAKSRDASWKTDKFLNFKAIFLKGIKVGEAESFSLNMIPYLSKKKYDIIVVGMYSSPTGMIAIEYMKLKKIPFVISSDGGLIKNDKGIKYKLKARYISAASAWLSTGSATTEYLCHYGAHKSQVYVYPFSSVKDEDVLLKPVSQIEKDELRHELGMKEKRIIISVGQFIHRKGYDILLRACKDVDKNIGVYIIGGEPTEEYIQLKKELYLTNVYFVGFMRKDQLSKYYRAADLFVLPTREDIWGLVVNEAMAYGLPVITTDKCVAGIEMIVDGLTGNIIPVDNVEVLSSKLIERDIYNRSCVLDKAKEYSIEQMAKRHIVIFNQIWRQTDDK